MVIQNMATTSRHNRLLYGFSDEISYYHRDEIRAERLIKFQDEICLVYSGELFCLPKLISADSYNENISYRFVQPDFMVFYQNKFATNKKGTRIAGYPDLIVEVWSDHNTEEEIMYKKELYATGKNIHHWYLTQDSNRIERWYDTEQLEDESLENIIKMSNGFIFDLSYLKV